jgi:hypothetical protein
MTDRELPTSMLTSTSKDVIEVTNSDVDVTANNVEITTFRSTIRPSLTSTNVSLSFDRSCGFDKKLEQDRIGIRLTDKLNSVTDYKWML